MVSYVLCFDGNIFVCCNPEQDLEMLSSRRVCQVQSVHNGPHIFYLDDLLNEAEPANGRPTTSD